MLFEPPAHVAFDPDGFVIDHTTVPVGLGSPLTKGFGTTVAVNFSIEPGWAGVGEETSVTVVVEAALPTVMVPVPLPAP